ncbi:MAG TPA: hypothetical protein PK390_06705 [Fervidobacterium nodosum]|nr:hypothetical protein [Fervidobacterium nodosum]
MNLTLWTDFLLGWLPFYQQLKTIVINAVILAEVNQSNSGAERKQAALKAIAEAIKEMGIKITIPESWFNLIVSTLIDVIVATLNNVYGKDWINKLFK